MYNFWFIWLSFIFTFGKKWSTETMMNYSDSSMEHEIRQGWKLRQTDNVKGRIYNIACFVRGECVQIGHSTVTAKKKEMLLRKVIAGTTGTKAQNKNKIMGSILVFPPPHWPKFSLWLFYSILGGNY